MNWTICNACSGRGKTRQKTHKKKRLPHGVIIDEPIGTETEIDFSKLPHGGYINVCKYCSGSGLLESESVTPINNDYPHVSIIGGGIGGTALAVACQHRGIPFTLYEKDPAFDARSQGYGLTLQQASNAIAGLGIKQLDGGITSNRHVVHTPDGTIIGQWGARRWNVDQTTENSKRKNVHISRQSLRAQLMQQLDITNAVQWGYVLSDIDTDDFGKTTITLCHGDQMLTRQTDLVVGSDGIYSTVRKKTLTNDNNPLQYLGCIVILGICPLDSLSDSGHELLDQKTVFQTVNGHERVYIMPYDDKHVMWQISFPATEEIAKHMHADGPKTMKQEILSRLKSWHEPIIDIVSNTDVSDITGYPVYDRKTPSEGRLDVKNDITLIGDAAHPMSPFKGQGANQALLDALALARAISIQCTQEPEWRKTGLRTLLLDDFETEMLQRTESKVAGSALAAKLLHSDSVLRQHDGPRGGISIK